MSTRSIAGIVALVSGLLLVVLVLLSAATVTPNPAFAGPLGPGMMGGAPHGQMPLGGMGGMMGFGRSGPASTAIPAAPEVRVTAGNFFFDPSEIRLPANADANLTLVNPTGVPHDLTVPGLGIHLVARAGETATIGLRDLSAGRYEAFCSIPGHAESGMRAVVVVD